MREQASLSRVSKAGRNIPVLRFCGEWSPVSGLDLLASLPFFFSSTSLSCHAQTPYSDEKNCIGSYLGLLHLDPLTKRDSTERLSLGQ